MKKQITVLVQVTGHKILIKSNMYVYEINKYPYMLDLIIFYGLVRFISVPDIGYFAYDKFC